MNATEIVSDYKLISFVKKYYLMAICVIGLLIRFILILSVSWMNASDLQNYFWAGDQVVRDQSAYRLWAQNLAGPRADVLPLELAILSLVVGVGRSPHALRGFFLLGDVLVLFLAYRLLADQPRRRALWLLLYALTPGPLYFFTLTPSDKPWILAGILAVLELSRNLHRPRFCALAIVSTGLLAAFKWFGLFFTFPIAWACGRQRIARLLMALAGVGLIFGVTHLLWFPDWMVVYQFRRMRFGLPFHSGLAVLLQALGLPMPLLYLPLMATSWIRVQYLYLRGRIRIHEAIVLSILSVLIWAPDTTAQMLFWLTLLMLLVTSWETPLWAGLIFFSTTWMTLMAAAAIGQVIPGLPLVDHLARLSGPYGGIRLALWSHLPLALLALRILSFGWRSHEEDPQLAI